MEQATKGQIGQPAACMIENNAHLQTDIGAGLWLTDGWPIAAVTAGSVMFSGVGHSGFNTQNLWITLWASLCREGAKPHQTVIVTKR
jgi:hypothetical protein